MKRLFLIFLAAGASLVWALDPIKHGCTDVYAYHYLALSCLSYTPTGTCQSYELQRPEPGVVVDLFITPVDGTGWHTSGPHLQSIIDGVARPPAVTFPDPVFPQHCVTGSDGFCNWFVRHNGWSGYYDVIMIPQNKTLPDGTVLKFPPYADRYYAGATVNDKNGNPQTFVPFLGSPYASGTYPDTRHLDSNGSTGYNRFGESTFVKLLQKVAYNYYSSVDNGGTYRIAPRRLSLPDGCNADNQVDINGQFSFQPWVVQPAGANGTGIAADLVNPAQFVEGGANTQAGVYQFGLVRKLMRKAGIRLSKVKLTGETIPSGGSDPEPPIALYWYGQLWNRYIATGPILPQPGQ